MTQNSKCKIKLSYEEFYTEIKCITKEKEKVKEKIETVEWKSNGKHLNRRERTRRYGEEYSEEIHFGTKKLKRV